MIRDDLRKPLARYGAIGDALACGFAPLSYTTTQDLTEYPGSAIIAPAQQTSILTGPSWVTTREKTSASRRLARFGTDTATGAGYERDPSCCFASHFFALSPCCDERVDVILWRLIAILLQPSLCDFPCRGIPYPFKLPREGYELAQ